MRENSIDLSTLCVERVTKNLYNSIMMKNKQLLAKYELH